MVGLTGFGPDILDDVALVGTEGCLSNRNQLFLRGVADAGNGHGGVGTVGCLGHMGGMIAGGIRISKALADLQFDVHRIVGIKDGDIVLGGADNSLGLTFRNTGEFYHGAAGMNLEDIPIDIAVGGDGGAQGGGSVFIIYAVTEIVGFRTVIQRGTGVFVADGPAVGSVGQGQGCLGIMKACCIAANGQIFAVLGDGILTVNLRNGPQLGTVGGSLAGGVQTEPIAPLARDGKDGVGQDVAGGFVHNEILLAAFDLSDGDQGIEELDRGNAGTGLGGDGGEYTAGVGIDVGITDFDRNINGFGGVGKDGDAVGGGADGGGGGAGFFAFEGDLCGGGSALVDLIQVKTGASFVPAAGAVIVV